MKDLDIFLDNVHFTFADVQSPYLLNAFVDNGELRAAIMDGNTNVYARIETGYFTSAVLAGIQTRKPPYANFMDIYQVPFHIHPDAVNIWGRAKLLKCGYSGGEVGELKVNGKKQKLPNIPANSTANLKDAVLKNTTISNGLIRMVLPNAWDGKNFAPGITGNEKGFWIGKDYQLENGD